MAHGLELASGVFLSDGVAPEDLSARYDVGVWVAGYEARSGWLVQNHTIAPRVDSWLRVEFEEDRTVLSAPSNLSIGIGTLVGGNPGRRNWDGEWSRTWDSILDDVERKTRGARLLVDYSSMPRTVLGPLILAFLRRSTLKELTLAYVPGKHGPEVSGARTLEGLRSLAGLEGTVRGRRQPVFLLGLGFDGVLAEAIIEVFQVSTLACLYAKPGVEPESAQRTESVNQRILRRADRSVTAPVGACAMAYEELARLRDWFDNRDVLLVPIGPKPHVLASILLASQRRDVAFRFVRTGHSRPVQVHATDNAVPFVTRLERR